LSKTKESYIKKLNTKKICELIRTDTETFDEYQTFLIQQKKFFNLSNCDLSHSSLEGLTFRNTDFSKGQFIFSKIKHCNFVNCNLSDTDFHGSDFADCNFIDCDFQNSKLNNTVYRSVFFYQCNLTNAYMNCASFEQSLFKGTYFISSSFECCTTQTCFFIGCDLLNLKIAGTCSLEENIFSQCKNVPRGISSALDMQIYEVSSKEKTFDIPKEEAAKKINSTKYSKFFEYE
jgi:uncharacterized protein YjbI with pentapeptide repeats